LFSAKSKTKLKFFFKVCKFSVFKGLGVKKFSKSEGKAYCLLIIGLFRAADANK